MFPLLPRLSPPRFLACAPPLLLAWAPLLGCSLDVTPLAGRPLPGATAGPTDAGGLDAGRLDAGAGGPDAGAPIADRTYLVAAGDLRLVLLDLSDPSAPIELSALDPRDADDEEPLPLYSLSVNERGHIFAGRYGAIEAYGIEGETLADLATIRIGSGHALSVQAAGTRLYAALGEEGVRIFDVSDLQAARVVGQIPAQRSIHDVALIDADHLSFYDGDDSALFVYDVRDPAAPVLTFSWITDFVGSRSSGMAASGGFVAVNATYQNGGSGLWFWIVRDLNAPASLGFHPDVRAPRGGGVALWPMGESVFGYFTDSEIGVVIAEATTNRVHPRSGLLPGTAFDALIHERVLYVAEGDNGVAVYALNEERPEAPERTRTVTPLARGTYRLARVQVERGDREDSAP
ncbi:MAG: hypothetical protein IT384_26310 [Deltaproteobacteria bacterium]|nr:hypothetical protein [Deltaproteobacteria bacterium]